MINGGKWELKSPTGKSKNIVFALLLSTQGTNLEIKTDTKTYKLSWKNVDVMKVAFGGLGQDYNAISGYKRSKLWASTINGLKQGVPPQTNPSQ